MAQTSIAWADHSLNCIRAVHKETGREGHFCVKVSEECQFCYSSALQRRFGTGLEFANDNSQRGKVTLGFTWKPIDDLKRIKKPKVVFWCSMTDLFLTDHSEEWIDRCFASMWNMSWHTHMILTKRPERMRGYLAKRDRLNRLANQAWARLAETEPHKADLVTRNDILRDMTDSWPFANVMLGVSVGIRAAKPRIDALRECPAWRRFISAEPLLEDLELRGPHSLNGIDLVITGGESGPQARDCHLKHVRQLRDFCSQIPGISPCHFLKQLGSRPVEEDGTRIKVSGKGEDPSEWPIDLRENCRNWPGPLCQR